MLIHTLPKTEAEAAVIARVKQLTDFKWTPVRDVPTYTKEGGQTVLEAGVEVTGFPYSSPDRHDTFLTENISFESFLTAIPNPYSKIYQFSHSGVNACYFGIVCNGLVRYALGIQRRVPTAIWGTIPGMNKIIEAGEYKVDDLLLCDVLHANGNGRNHVAIITDILKNENGEIVEIEVSEAVRPSCRRATYSTERFYEKYKLFALWRYEKLEEVPPLDKAADRFLWESGAEKIAPKIAIDKGNRSNYIAGDDVQFAVSVEETDTVEIYCDGEVVKSFPVTKRAIFPYAPKRGYYTARLKEAGDFVEFCVNEAELSAEVHDGIVTVKADPCDEKSRILYLDLREKGNKIGRIIEYHELTDEEKAKGVFSRPIPENCENFKVSFENEYGVWVHPMKSIF